MLQYSSTPTFRVEEILRKLSPKGSPITIKKATEISEKSLLSRSLALGSFSDESSLEDELFDIMPKTDYTYSRSGSYSKRHLKEKVESPNMSRRRIRSQGHSLSMDNSSYVSDYGEEAYAETDDGSLSDSSNEESQWKRIPSKGISLRSGHRLKSTRSVLSSDDTRQHHHHHHQDSASHMSMGSSMSMSRSRERLVGSTGSDVVSSTDVISNQLSSNTSSVYSVQQSTINSMNQYAQPAHNVNINRYSVPVPNQTIVTTNSSSGSGHSIKTVKKTLVEEFEETEYEEKGSREAASGKDSRLGKSRSKINNLYGLDYEEFSDGEYVVTGQSSKSSASWPSSNIGNSGAKSTSSSSASASSSWTTVTVVTTTVIDTVTTFSKTLLTPMWNAIGQPVMNVMSSLAGWMWALVEYLVMKVVLIDAWLLARRRSRGLCCLCLPLLLLLPLALLGGTYLSSEESFMPVLWSRGFFPLLWSSEDKTIIQHVNSVEDIKIGDDIRRIIIQLQQNSKHQLGATEVERIVRNILGAELASLKLDLVEGRNKATVDQKQWNINHAAMFEEMQDEFRSLSVQIHEMESKLSVQREYMQMHSSKVDNGSSNIYMLEAQLAELHNSFRALELSQQALQLQLTNCCRNESAYILAIQHRVNAVLAQMMAGEATGNPTQDAFSAWLHAHYVSQTELDTRLMALAKDITVKILAVEEKGPQVIIKSDGTPGISEQFVTMIVEQALLKYSADKTGMADYALESAGGSIVSTRCSETYYRKTAQISIFGIPLWYSSNSPRTVIQPEVHPGQCWAFHGSQGYIVIQLSTGVTPSVFALEHIPKSVSPTGNIDTAPKDFSVFGLSGKSDHEGISLGNYTYNRDGNPLQLFPVQIADPGPHNFIMLHIDSNHGSLDYTCLYRFRVHGQLYRP